MYDIFYIGNQTLDNFPTAKRIDNFQHAQRLAMTKMFWVVWDDIAPLKTFDFKYQADDWSLDVTHVFKNKSHFDGICLFPKDVEVTQEELDKRLFKHKKEVDVVASVPKSYDILDVEDYEDYLQKVSNATSDFVYIVPPRLIVDFDFNFQIPVWDRDITYTFRNGNCFDGIMLQSRHKQVSKREFEFCWYTIKKEIDMVASKPNKYDIIHCASYEEYLDKISDVDSEFVYIIPSDVTLDQDFKFDYQPPLWERDVVHTFKNGKYNDGIFLHHRSKKIAKREFEFCWFTKTKELEISASTPSLYDIVFISYNEPNAEDNFKRLQQRFPRAKRVDGVKGIHQAHIAAAEICDTELFWVVDADAQIVDDFDFDYQVPKWKKDQVFVWHSQNPINGLIYGYGGVKLFPRKETLNMDTTKPDMTTSISSKFNSVKEVSNITAFNTDPFNTWKSAFRECVKLSAKIIDRQDDDETDKRLFIWCRLGRDEEFGEYAISGANTGRDYGTTNKDNLEALKLINDFDWLKEFYQQQ